MVRLFTVSTNSEVGGMAVIASVIIGAMLLIASLVVDVGLVRVEHRQINLASDAAALAGVLKLLQPGATASDAVSEAQNVAAANGLSAAEISSRGTIQVGHWDGSQFLTGASPLNAVRVPGERSVLFSLGRLFWNHMDPTVDSIASLASSNDVSCLIPFGLEWPALFDVNNNDAPLYQPGDYLTISRASPGNWGKIDIGANMSSAPNFLHAMQGTGCDLTVSVGDTFDSATGFAGVRDGFQWRLDNDPIVTLSVVDEFKNGNKKVDILAFVVLEIISVSGNGNNWNITFKFLDSKPVGGTGGGGPSSGVLANSRVLVQ